MDYLYENLGDERFQQFCTALISKEFKDIQAFPVGQPDGGRDSIAYIMETPEKQFIVFQVKFVRSANIQRDIHQWFTETVHGEAEKINSLIPKGAKAYYLLTNVRGTAHLDSGSKDKINKIFTDNIKVPAICWWRDDLSVLFEKDPLFKWSFPEILNGQDIFNSMLFDGLNENKERREIVVRAYLADQFEMDGEVKFKQIDLQNRLLTLYTDVPLRVKKINLKNKKLVQVLTSLNLISRTRGHDSNLISNEDNVMSAAEFLLDAYVQRQIDRVLIEGGPGQGKSTISQYVCQVHRARLLSKADDIELLPEKIKQSPVRLPFKIDLRDMAAWIEKKNPYEAIISEEAFLSKWKGALESFLLTHVLYHSKVDDFTSSDFFAVCKSTPVLFVFDGFDEIASIELRSQVIEFINKGINRLAANAKSIQVFITSRPAAFTDSVGFSTDNYPHFELTEITTPVINEYVDKWIKSSKIDVRDANALRKLIQDKLSLPHLKDLAKSPMQLAIFISLLRTKGQSLPNKRTALYDNYINLFFDRESEKNSLILDRRDLIIDIHQYLAWVLHSEAELYKNSGSISLADLQTRLKEYLSNEGHDPAITDQLFDVMKERVCALVSRVQGTFEFEVQPLREYFCAKFLYKSAPHSSAGDTKTGTKPDRFHAILRSFYWQNVVRFFAGCADAGELDMIIQEIKDLQEDEFLKYTDYPRIITAQILSDYVFTQKPLKVKEVVKIIVNGINVGNIINQDSDFSSNEIIQIPNECGRIEVINECFSQLSTFPQDDYSSELIAIINNNQLDVEKFWRMGLAKYKGKDLTKWLEYGYKLRLIYKIDETTLSSLLKNTDEYNLNHRLQIVVDGNRQELFDKDLSLKRSALKSVLNFELIIFDKSNASNSLNSLCILFLPFIISDVYETKELHAKYIEFVESHWQSFIGGTNTKLTDIQVKDSTDELIQQYLLISKPALNTLVSEFRSNLEPWEMLVENARNLFGECWSLNIMATLSAGIKSVDLLGEYNNLCDKSVSLCKRVRFARLKSGNTSYWRETLENEEEILFKLLVFFTWCTPKTMIQLIPSVVNKLKMLSEEETLALKKAVSAIASVSTFSRRQEDKLRILLSRIEGNDEVKYFISLRFNRRDGSFVYENVKNAYGSLSIINEENLGHLITQFFYNSHDQDILSKIKELYPKVKTMSNLRYIAYSVRNTAVMPYELAKTIMENPKEYPQIISTAAERSCRRHAIENLMPVGKIAEVERWFEV
jgi:hypothetical protein